MIVKLASAVLTFALVCPATAAASEPDWQADHLPRHFTGSLKLSSDRPGDIDLQIDSASAEGAQVVFEGYISVVNDSYRLPLEGRISTDLRTFKARRGQGTSRVLLNVVAD